MKSSRPESAQWRSSKTITTVPVRGDPLEERAPRGEQLARGSPARPSDAQQRQQRGLDPAPLVLVRDPLARPSRATLAPGRRARRRSRAGRQRPRTISPSAQKVMPSP